MPPGVGSQHVAQDFESDATDTETRTLALGATGTLELKNVSGTIECVVAASVSGDVSVTGIRTAGGPGGRSVSGDVTVEAVQANRIDARSVSGAVGVTRAETAEASLGSTSGDVTYDGALAEQGRNEVRSHSGDARITLDAGTGFELRAATFSGSIRADQAVASGGDGDSARAVRTTVGDGSAVIEAATFSGDITVATR